MADISVIIPCYNVEKWIDRCMESIVRQTIGVERLEIICVDDASTDSTREQLQEWEKRYPDQIVLVFCEENGRQGTARNIGLEYASAPWIAFVDSDDWVELDYLEKLYQYTDRSVFDLIICGFRRDDSKKMTFFLEDERNGSEKNRAMKVDSEKKRKLFFHLRPLRYPAWAKLIRKSFLVENVILFPERIAYEDTFWGQLLHMYVENVYIIEEKLYHYFVNNHSTVLSSESDYSLDLLTAQSMLWSEWKKRDFYGSYKAELDFEFLYTCCLGFLKIIILRYEEPSYSQYLYLCSYVVEHIPDIAENVYVKDATMSEYHLSLMKMLLQPLTKSQFYALAADVKKIGL